ncbi:MAG: thioredoxin [Candidatus Puniceispirillales bacterium]
MVLSTDMMEQAAPIVDVSSADFMQEVIEASHQQPVIVDFWAPWCGPCKQLMPLLEDAVTRAGGKVKLAKVNIDENQAVAAQLRVQSVPTVYAFVGGQPVDGFAGAQPGSAVEAFVQRLVDAAGDAPSVDDILAEAETAIGAREFEKAAMLFQEALAAKPDEAAAMAGLIRCLTGLGDHQGARDMAAALTDEMQEADAVKAALAALDVAEEARASADKLADLEAQSAATPGDPATLYDLALAQFGSGNGEAAIDSLLESMKLDRGWNDDAARIKLLEIFAALGPTAPEVAAGRRKLSSMLFS